MALLLRKAWGSVLNRSGSSSSSSSSSSRNNSSGFHSENNSSSMGAFDQLPLDVVMQITRLFGPKDAARMSTVSKSWRFFVSDDTLWIYFLKNGRDSLDSVIFAETHLRSMYVCPSLPLSFMNIYAQRERVPGSVIIDGGSGYCKYGWSKYAAPSGRCATFLEFGNIESPMYSRLRHFFSTIYNRMQVKPSSQPVIVSIPICHSDDTDSARASRRQLRETMYSVLFDMSVPVVCAIDQAILSLYAGRHASGILVNIGFHATSVVPIFQGKVMREVGVEIVGLGALKITGHLRELMQQRNITFESLYTIRTIKEKLCYVAANYDVELRKDTKASCEVAGEGLFTLSKERFQAAEILFQPQIGGVHAMGLHRAVALCMDHCAEAELPTDDGWFKTVVMAGGTSCLPGLPERLEKELHKLLPTSMSQGIKVMPPPYGADSAWFGAKILSNVSTFSESWCMTKKQFRQKSRRSAPSFIGPW